MDFKEADNNGNFKLNHYHENYGYDLEAALSKHPIKELENAKFKDDLMDSLKKGNLQSATFLKDGTEVKQYIEANPQFKTVNVFDDNMKRLDRRQAKEESQSEGEKTSAKQENKKQNAASDEEAPAAQKENIKKKKSQSNSM